MEASGMISIWFFIGISLAVNGALILAAGIYQLVNPPADPGVVLFNLHAGVWWGAALLVFGLIFCFKFAGGGHPQPALLKKVGLGGRGVSPLWGGAAPRHHTSCHMKAISS